jgi:hypothetical protein
MFHVPREDEAPEGTNIQTHVKNVCHRARSIRFTLVAATDLSKNKTLARNSERFEFVRNHQLLREIGPNQAGQETTPLRKGGDSRPEQDRHSSMPSLVELLGLERPIENVNTNAPPCDISSLMFLETTGIEPATFGLQSRRSPN